MIGLRSFAWRSFSRAAQVFDVLEAVAFVKTLGVFRAQHLSGVTQFGMFHQALHHPFAQSLATVIGVDDDIANPGEGRAISHRAGEADLLAGVKQAEAQRVLHTARDDFGWPVRGPVSVSAAARRR